MVGIGSGSVGSAGCVAAELASIEVFSVLGMEVGDGLVEVAVFEAYLDAVTTFEKAVVDLGVGDVGTGELRVRGLATELREACNGLAVETTVDAGIAWNIGDVEVCEQIVGADVYGRLAALRPGESEAKLQNGVGGGGEVVAAGYLSRVGVESSVTVAASESWNVWRKKDD